MPTIFLIGLCAGFATAFTGRTFLFFTGELPFGIFPFLFSLYLLLPFSTAKRDRKKPVDDRLPFLAAGAAPILLFLIDLLTAHFSFLSGEPTVGAFLLRCLTALIVLAPPVFLHRYSSLGGRWRLLPRDSSLSPALFLAGAGAGLAAEYAAASISPLWAAFPAALLAAAAMALLALQLRPAAGKKTKGSGVKTGGEKPATEETQKENGAAGKGRFGLPAVSLLTAFGATAWLSSRSLLLKATVNPPPYYNLYLALLAVAGIASGWYAARLFMRGKTRKMHPAMLPMLLFAMTAAALLLAWMYDASYHARLFLDFQNGTESRSTQHLLGLLMIFLPALLSGLLLSAAQAHARMEGSGTLRFIPWSAAAGLLFFLTYPELSWMPILGMVTVVLAAAAVILVAEERSFRSASALFALLACAGTVGSFFLQTDRPLSLVDTNRFTLVAEQGGPSGLHTLIRYRNYDDPFTAILYNHATTLAQTSEQFHGLYQRMGLLPMIVQGNPRSVLYVGIGSAEPLNTIAHGESEIQVVEENAAMIRLADSAARAVPRSYRRRHLEFFCERPLPFLVRNKQSWDLIVRAEPFSEPFTRLSAFSAAWYEAARDRLTPDGIYAEWLPLGRFDAATLRSVIATIVGVFPEATLWFGDANPRTGMACVIASRRPMPVTGKFLAAAAERMAVLDDLKNCGFNTLPDIYSCFALSRESLRLFSGGGALIGRMHPEAIPVRQGVEIENGAVQMYQTLFQRRDTPPIDPALPDSVRIAIDKFLKEETVLNAVQRHLAFDQRDTARSLLFGILKENPENSKARILLSEALTYDGAVKIQNMEFAGARTVLEEALRLHRLTAYLSRLLMIATYKLGDKSAANAYINEGLRLNRMNAGLYDNAATLFANDSLYAAAERNFKRALAINPRDVDIYCNFASAMYNARQEWDAVRLLDRAIQLCPNPSRAYYLQGVLYNAMKRPREAVESTRRFLRTALPNDPDLEKAAAFVEQGKQALGGL